MSKRHVTYTGRIVYTRKKHAFTERDAVRIATSLMMRDPRGVGILLVRLFMLMLRAGVAIWVRATRRAPFAVVLDTIVPNLLWEILLYLGEVMDNAIVHLTAIVVSILGIVVAPPPPPPGEGEGEGS